MGIEEAMGRRWRARAAGVLAAAVAASSASAADAKDLVVRDGGSHGHGTLAAAIKRANHTGRPDRISFRRGLRRVRLRSDVAVTNPLLIDGPGRGRLTIQGPRDGARITLQANNVKREYRMTVRDLSTSRVGLAGDAVDAEANLKVRSTSLSGDGVHLAGVDFDGAYYGGGATVRDSTITGFTTGVHTFYESATVSHSVVKGNGTGVLAFEGTAHVKSSTVSGNGPGGGVVATYYAFADVRKSTISGNNSAVPREGAVSLGGGVYANGFASGQVINSTISGNTAEGAGSRGGGVYGEVTVLGSTVTGNTAEQGSGVFGTGDATTEGSIVDANGGGPDCGGSLESKGHNLFPPTGCFATGPGDVLAADPGLGALAENGGPTRTHALLPGSPAIGASTDIGLDTDQRGVKRGKDPDIGAYERRGG
jgi:hypothetical protein